MIGGQPTIIYRRPSAVVKEPRPRHLSTSSSTGSIAGLATVVNGITLLHKLSERWSRASIEELWKATEIDSKQSNTSAAESKEIVQITLSMMRDYGTDTQKLSEVVANRLNETHGGKGHGSWVVLVADGFAQKAESRASRWLLFRVGTIYFTLFYTQHQSWGRGIGRWVRRRVHEGAETVALVGGALAGMTNGLTLWHAISHETRSMSVDELRKATIVDESTFTAAEMEAIHTLTFEAIREHGESTQAMDDWLTAQLNRSNSGWEVIVADQFADAVKRTSSVIDYSFFRVKEYYFTIYRLELQSQTTLGPDAVITEFALPNSVRSRTLQELVIRSQFVDVRRPLEETDRTLALDLATRSIHAHGESNLEMSKAMVRNLAQRTGREGWRVWVTETGFVTPPSEASCTYFVIFGYYFTVVLTATQNTLQRSASWSSSMSTMSINEFPEALQGAHPDSLHSYIEVHESTLSASRRQAAFEAVVQALHQHHASPGKVRSFTTTYLDKTLGPQWHLNMGHSFTTAREQLSAEHVLFVLHGIHFSLWRSDTNKQQRHGWLHKFI